MQKKPTFLRLCPTTHLLFRKAAALGDCSPKLWLRPVLLLALHVDIHGLEVGVWVQQHCLVQQYHCLWWPQGQKSTSESYNQVEGRVLTHRDALQSSHIISVAHRHTRHDVTELVSVRGPWGLLVTFSKSLNNLPKFWRSPSQYANADAPDR